MEDTSEDDVSAGSGPASELERPPGDTAPGQDDVERHLCSGGQRRCGADNRDSVCCQFTIWQNGRL